MKIKRCHYTSIWMAHILKCWQYQVLVRQINWNPHILLVGMAKWYSHSQKYFSVSYKMKYIFTIWPSNSTPEEMNLFTLFTLKKWKLMLHKNLSMNIYSSSSHNYPKREPTQSSFSKWMDKQTVVPPYNGRQGLGVEGGIGYDYKKTELFGLWNFSVSWSWWWSHKSIHVLKRIELTPEE